MEKVGEGVPDQKVQAELAASLIHDFYLSFKFSQGDGLSQDWLISYLAYYYRSVADCDQTILDSILSNQQVAGRVAKLRPPARHSTERLSNREDEFRSVYDELRRVLSTTEQPVPTVSDLRHIALEILNRDKKYVISDMGRPNPHEHTGVDLHESFFREYIIMAKPTGSEAFDHMYLAIRSSLIGPVDDAGTLGITDDTIRERAMALAPQWELRHPGETFFDIS